MNAKRLPSGSWRCRVFLGRDSEGKQIFKSVTDTSKRRCEARAAIYLDEHKMIHSKDSLGSAMEHYITSKTPVLSPSTIRAYLITQRQLEDNHADLCRKPVFDIDSDTLQQLINEWTQCYSPKTIRNKMGLVLSILRSQGAAIPSVTLPQKKKAELHIPDEDDVRKILEIAQGTSMHIPILLAAFVPMRRSEICALTMDDLSVDNMLTINKSIVRTSSGVYIQKSPKTYESNRVVQLLPEIADLIREKGEFFDSRNPDRISERWHHLARRAGLEGTRFHDLRHFCCSFLHAQGVPEQEILSRGGWSDDGIMRTVYRHRLETSGRIETQRINELLKDKFF